MVLLEKRGSMFQYWGRGITHGSSEAPEIVEREIFEETKTNKILVVECIIVKEIRYTPYIC